MHPPPALLTFRCDDCGYTRQVLFITDPLCEDCQLWAHIVSLPREALDEIVALNLARERIRAIYVIREHLDITLGETLRLNELVLTLLKPGNS